MKTYEIHRALKAASRFGYFVAFFRIVNNSGTHGTPDVDCWYTETLGM